MKRVHQQVNVLGHVDERNELNARFVSRRVDALREPTPPVVIAQQRKSLVARESQLVKMPRFVKMLHGLTMSHDSGATGSASASGVTGSASAFGCVRATDSGATHLGAIDRGVTDVDAAHSGATGSASAGKCQRATNNWQASFYCVPGTMPVSSGATFDHPSEREPSAYHTPTRSFAGPPHYWTNRTFRAQLPGQHWHSQWHPRNANTDRPQYGGWSIPQPTPKPVPPRRRSLLILHLWRMVFMRSQRQLWMMLISVSAVVVVTSLNFLYQGL